MATPSSRHQFTFREYVELEERSRDLKHEFIAGAVIAMAAATPEHAALTLAIGARLMSALSGTPCQPFASDLGIRIREADVGVYPDVAVVCGPLELAPDSSHHVTNPRVVVEVLSPSTEAYDRGEKRRYYQMLASLREYVLVAQDRRCIEVWHRDGDSWRHAVYEAGARVTLASISAELDVDDVYTFARL